MNFSGDNFYCDNDRYERSKIEKLRFEREEIQAKTYKNWINSILIQSRTNIDNIYTDFNDGEKLIKLLRLLTGENVGTINKSSSLLHKIANVSQCLRFIRNKNVYLESIGPDDIVNGNKTLTLGLIWTLILRFQLSRHLDFEQYDLKTIKESLLLWCCNRIKHLDFIEINDFHQSWQNGWAFIALVHSFRPESLDINALRQMESRELLTIAFDTGYQQLLIPKILDIDDVINKPDENSILTYVSFYYNLHSRTKNSETNIKRIQYLLTNISDVDNMQDSYKQICHTLLEWISTKSILFERDVPMDHAQDEMFEFNQYFFNERFEKLNCRNHCETLYFEIISMQKKAGIKIFRPENGLKVKDLEKAWLNLEIKETRRLSKLKNLINQKQKICQQIQLFDLKSEKFENYICSKLKLLNKIFLIEKSSLQNLEQHLQQSEAICLDIIHDNNNMKFDSLISLANELIEQQQQQQQSNDSKFYSQYLNHIDEKLKRLQELASSNLTTIELTRHLFVDLSCIENIVNESNDLYGQINTIIVDIQSNNSIQSIMLNLEKLKYLEIYLIVLEKDYIESKRKFDSIRLDDKYRFCFVILDIDDFEKKLNDSKLNIIACRDLIEKLKRISEYKIQLNKFYTNVEYLWQFLNEKILITQSNPDDCLNFSQLHFLQRRNNIIKLELKVMERELYDTCKQGYLIIDSQQDNVDKDNFINESIEMKIEKIKINFKNFIVTINERTLLINDCLQLYQLIDELRQHKKLIENLNENFLKNIQEKIDLYQNDLLYLGEILNKLGQLSIRIERFDSITNDQSKYIVYLKNYQLDRNRLESLHYYLIIELNFPDINLNKFRTIHLNLFELIRDRIDHIKQLISITRSDFNLRKLKQMLSVKIDENDGDDIIESNPAAIPNTSSVAEIDLIFQLFFEQYEPSSYELEDSLNERNHFVVNDFHNMNRLSELIKHTMKLIKSAQDIVDLCQIENRSDIVQEERLVSDEMSENISENNEHEQQQFPVAIEDHSESIQLVNIVEIENDDDDDDDKIPSIEIEIESEEEQKHRAAIIMKKKIFIHKLKNDIIFIYHYFINNNQQSSNQDLKFKLNFLTKILKNNVKRIEIYIIEHPEDDNNSVEMIQKLSNELKKCSLEIDRYQTLSTFKDLIDDFYLNINNHFDSLKCINVIDLNELNNEQYLRNDLRTIESIECSYGYYKDLFDEFQQLNNDSDEQWQKYIVDLTLIFEKFNNTIQLTKEFLNKHWKCLQEKKKKIRLESFMKRLYRIENKQTNPRIDNDEMVKVENSSTAIDECPIQNDLKDRKDSPIDTSLEDLIREIEIILFDVNCGINMHRYKSEQIDTLLMEAQRLTDDEKILNKLQSYKKQMNIIIRKQMDCLELENFQSTSEYFQTCLKQDLQIMNELIENLIQKPINNEQRNLIETKIINLKFNYRHYTGMIEMIQQNFLDSKQPEICSKKILLNDLFQKFQQNINHLMDLLIINNDYNKIYTNIEYITIIIEEYNDIDLETLKELQMKTNECIEQMKLFKNEKFIKMENSMKNEAGKLDLSINRLQIIIRYKILKYELAKKLKKFENRFIDEENDEFRAFIDEILEQQKILDQMLLKDFNENQIEMFQQILINFEILMKKLDSFGYLIEIDLNRKSLESTADLIIEPIRPSSSSKIIKRIINKKPKKIAEIKKTTFTNQLKSETSSISSEDIINNNYCKDFDDITEQIIKSTTILHENEDDDEDNITKIYEVCIELVKPDEDDEKQDDRIVVVEEESHDDKNLNNELIKNDDDDEISTENPAATRQAKMVENEIPKQINVEMDMIIDDSNEMIPIINSRIGDVTSTYTNLPLPSQSATKQENNKKQQKRSSKKKKKSKKKSKSNDENITSPSPSDKIDYSLTKEFIIHPSTVDVNDDDDENLNPNEKESILEKNLTFQMKIPSVAKCCCSEPEEVAEEFKLNVGNDDWLDYLTPKIKTSTFNNDDDEISMNQKNMDEKLKNHSVQQHEQKPDKNDDENRMTKIDFLQTKHQNPCLTSQTPNLSFDSIDKNDDDHKVLEAKNEPVIDDFPIFKSSIEISDDWLDYLSNNDDKVSDKQEDLSAKNTVQAEIIDQDSKKFDNIDSSKSKILKKSRKNKKQKLNENQKIADDDNQSESKKYDNQSMNDENGSISEQGHSSKQQQANENFIDFESNKSNRKDMIEKFNELFPLLSNHSLSIKNRLISDQCQQQYEDLNDDNDDRKIKESCDENGPTFNHQIESIPALIYSHENPLAVALVPNDYSNDKEKTNEIILTTLNDNNDNDIGDYSPSLLSSDSNENINENNDDDDENNYAILNDLESRIDTINDQIQLIIIQIAILFSDNDDDECFRDNQQQQQIRQLENLIESRNNHPLGIESPDSNNENVETNNNNDPNVVDPNNDKQSKVVIKNPGQQPSLSTDVWLDYLSPVLSTSSSSSVSTNKFCELINWNEIENNVHCDLEIRNSTSITKFDHISDKHDNKTTISNNINPVKVETNSNEWMDYLSPQESKSSSKLEFKSSIIILQPVVNEISADLFVDDHPELDKSQNVEKQDLVDSESLNKLKDKPLEISNSFSDIWLDYLTPQNDSNSEEILENNKPNLILIDPSESIEFESKKVKVSDDWQDYLSPPKSNVSKSEFRTSIIEPLESNRKNELDLLDQQEESKKENQIVTQEKDIDPKSILIENGAQQQQTIDTIVQNNTDKNQCKKSKKKSKKHKKNPTSKNNVVINSVIDPVDDKKISINHLEPESIDSGNHPKSINEFHFNISDDWLDYLSFEKTNKPKFDQQTSIIDLQPFEKIDGETFSNDENVDEHENIKLNQVEKLQSKITIQHSGDSLPNGQQSTTFDSNTNLIEKYTNENDDDDEKYLINQLGPMIINDENDKLDDFENNSRKGENDRAMIANKNPTLPLVSNNPMNENIINSNEHSFLARTELIQKPLDPMTTNKQIIEPRMKNKTKTKRINIDENKQSVLSTNDDDNNGKLIDKNFVQKPNIVTNSTESTLTVNNSVNVDSYTNDIGNLLSSDIGKQPFSKKKQQMKIQRKQFPLNRNVVVVDKSLKVNDMNNLDAKINGNRERFDQTENDHHSQSNDGLSSTTQSSSTTKTTKFKRILQYSLPFYILLLFSLLLLLILPKNEIEFDCLRRQNYDYQITLKKMYLHGSPPI